MTSPDVVAAPLHDPAAAAAAYQSRGFVVLRGFFSAETMRTLSAETQQLWEDAEGRICRENLRCRYMPHHETGELLFECFDPVIDLAPPLAQIAFDARLLKVLGKIYGEPAHLFKDKLIFKPAGARGYPLHQDYIGWKNFPRSFLTVLIPLDAATEENGCTVVYEGLHRRGLFTPEDGSFHPTPRECVDGAPRVPLVMQPGDIAIFSGFTPHESNSNRSSASRRQLYLSYNADRDGGDRRAEHYQEFHRWLRERQPPPDGKAWCFL